MSFHSMNEGAQFVATSRDILLQNQITVTIGTNFLEYRQLLRDERPQQVMGAPFDPDVHDLNHKNAFWLIARDSDGLLMHTQASRLIDLKQQSLSGYMLKKFREFPPAIPDLDLERSRYRASPGANRITGQVVYHGEVWMGDTGQYRGTGLSTVLARYGIHEAMCRWNPDYIFGFMARTVAYKGFAERMGYMHNEPGALRWYRKGHEAPLEGFVSYLSNEDTRYLLEMPVVDVVDVPQRQRKAA
ncbi:hypothetical protein KX928_05815 [Roseobacter sp. YSTF-M11]|uniref:Uncharacterized protein n=1 Tax=Roseobacter insulae TaxID=2859783 RepID=A0A9X1FTU4_9RHOB|nr:hypothetical protein [Roseobacter insulae]MBW4707299.1 hypothetical protein [Roseobacter insulae]